MKHKTFYSLFFVLFLIGLFASNSLAQTQDMMVMKNGVITHCINGLDLDSVVFDKGVLVSINNFEFLETESMKFDEEKDYIVVRHTGFAPSRYSLYHKPNIRFAIKEEPEEEPKDDPKEESKGTDHLWTQTKQAIQVFAKNNQIIIHSPVKILSVSVYSLDGTLLHQTGPQNFTSSISSLWSGPHFVRLKTAEGYTIKKVLLHP